MQNKITILSKKNIPTHNIIKKYNQFNNYKEGSN